MNQRFADLPSNRNPVELPQRSTYGVMITLSSMSFDSTNWWGTLLAEMLVHGPLEKYATDHGYRPLTNWDDPPSRWRFCFQTRYMSEFHEICQTTDFLKVSNLESYNIIIIIIIIFWNLSLLQSSTRLVTWQTCEKNRTSYAWNTIYFINSSWFKV